MYQNVSNKNISLGSYGRVGVDWSFENRGSIGTWARPHLRFVTSVARYNDYAMETLNSPYLQFVGERRWGYYFGVKEE